jgi:hypothetical protein
MYTCSFAQHYQTARLVESFGVFPRRAVRHTHTARVWDVTGRSPSMDARSRAVRLPAARPRRPLHYNSTGSGSIGCGFKHRLRSRFTRRYCGNHGCCLVLRSLICLSSAGSRARAEIDTMFCKHTSTTACFQEHQLLALSSQHDKHSIRNDQHNNKLSPTLHSVEKKTRVSSG